MKKVAGIMLLAATTGLLGMGTRPASVPPTQGEAALPDEERALISELDAVEERAAAENMEFFQDLDHLQKLPAAERAVGEEEAN